MAAFAYRGRDGSGAAVSGTLEGVNPAAVADLLFGRGITPLDIRAVAGAAGGLALGWSRLRRAAIDALDVMLFSRQIHTLLKAGVPIMRALAGLRESATKPAVAEMVGGLRESLDAGRELSSALALYPRVFSPFYLAMVRVGEMTGRLEEVFIQLYRYLEFDKFMREQVRSALRYPSFVMLAMGVAIVIVNLWVIPTFARVFKGFNAKLPLMTELLIGFSDFMLAGWPILLALGAGAAIAFRSWAATPAGRMRWDRTKLELPVAGKIVRKATLARFARSFALAMRSGVPVVQAMGVVAETVDNAWLGAKILGMREGVERGESVLASAHASGVFTPVVLQMIAVGEETGALDDLMEEVGGMYQQEVEYELKTLAAQIEPILIVLLGALVLVLALGIFLPIWDLGRAALHRG